MGHNSNSRQRHPRRSAPIPPSDSKRVPRCAAGPSKKKYVVPRSADDISTNVKDLRIVFRFDCVDIDDDCPWSLKRMETNEHELLLRKLKDFESVTLGELLGGYSEFRLYSDFSGCPNPKPVNRLGELYETKSDSIARFRLGGTERLYGFLVGREFHITWWDPNHEIWPSQKKHT